MRRQRRNCRLPSNSDGVNDSPRLLRELAHSSSHRWRSDPCSSDRLPGPGMRETPGRVRPSREQVALIGQTVAQHNICVISRCVIREGWLDRITRGTAQRAGYVSGEHGYDLLGNRKRRSCTGMSEPALNGITCLRIERQRSLQAGQISIRPQFSPASYAVRVSPRAQPVRACVRPVSSLDVASRTPGATAASGPPQQHRCRVRCFPKERLIRTKLTPVSWRVYGGFRRLIASARILAHRSGHPLRHRRVVSAVR